MIYMLFLAYIHTVYSGPQKKGMPPYTHIPSRSSSMKIYNISVPLKDPENVIATIYPWKKKEVTRVSGGTSSRNVRLIQDPNVVVVPLHWR